MNKYDKALAIVTEAESLKRLSRDTQDVLDFIQKKMGQDDMIWVSVSTLGDKESVKVDRLAFVRFLGGLKSQYHERVCELAESIDSAPSVEKPRSRSILHKLRRIFNDK